MAEYWDILDQNGNKTGRLHERGEPMGKDEYHLCVYVFIENRHSEYLISQRTPNKELPHMWETTGGNAIAGDDSLTTALKEVKEELGITLDPQSGMLIKRCRHNERANFSDIWIFRQCIDISAVVLNPDETSDAMWASRDKINQMINDGTFTTWGLFNYIDEFF